MTDEYVDVDDDEYAAYQLIKYIQSETNMATSVSRRLRIDLLKTIL